MPFYKGKHANLEKGLTIAILRAAKVGLYDLKDDKSLEEKLLRTRLKSMLIWSIIGCNIKWTDIRKENCLFYKITPNKTLRFKCETCGKL